MNYVIYSTYDDPAVRSSFALYHPNIPISSRRIMGKSIVSTGSAVITEYGRISCTPDDNKEATRKADQEYFDKCKVYISGVR